MTDRIVAYCGIVCSDCAAYTATQAGDEEALKQVVKQWKAEYDVLDLTVSMVLCDGCLTGEGRRCYHCADCEIRACGIERGVVNCAHCPDYACERLTKFFGFVPDARAVLDRVYSTLH